MSEAAVMPRGNAVATTTAADMSGTGGRTDGRNRRAAETRRKVIEAAKAMIAETSTAPTVVAVAKRADVSVRSVFQHFGDVESLFVTVMDAIRKDVAAPAPTAANEPQVIRIASLVQNFAELFDKTVPLRVAAGQFVGHPALIERGLASKRELRAATFQTFAPEFEALDEQAREELADAIGAALSLDAWIVLRRRDGLSFERATAVWRRTLSALLGYNQVAAAAAE
ncbi:TetR/AcrR family transcriptional regulator [Reyranella sp.]|uniref:TetR/AcrR family transcriptional regulator n=1 Tax=Reyranella sp. TaxID=1929291 RepID=UPI0012208DE7|nr:TetR/AcrR family transcriptional regulator [Reyranella sp.]TAJ85892.1 MAG: TetR/AcrR family transcriptional regulator [Reyranella sp.]